eukprot:4018551-Pyramimonas_sp.AAC.1
MLGARRNASDTYARPKHHPSPSDACKLVRCNFIMRCADAVTECAVNAHDDAYISLRALAGKRITLHSQREARVPSSECHRCCYTPPCAANGPRRQESDSCGHLLAFEDAKYQMQSTALALHACALLRPRATLIPPFGHTHTRTHTCTTTR